jgi:hypothetical protein
MDSLRYDDDVSNIKSSKDLSIQERVDLMEEILRGESEVIDVKDLWTPEHRCRWRQILKSSKVEYIGDGAVAQIYRLSVGKDRKFSIVLREVNYFDPGFLGIHNPHRPVNVATSLFKRLNELLLQRVTPHIPLYGGSFFCQTPEKKYKHYTLVETASSNFRMLLAEFEEEDERSGIRINKDLFFRVLLFQIIYTLAVIQDFFPKYRHNDLRDVNVLVFERPDWKTFRTGASRYEYVLDKQSFYVPEIGVQAALWDYDLSSIQGQIDNTKIPLVSKPNGIRETQNHYYDLYSICYSILFVLKRHFKESHRIKPFLPLKHFLEDMIPKYKPFVKDWRYLLADIEWTTPKKALQHPYFDPFRIPTSKIINRFGLIYTYVDSPALLLEPFTLTCDAYSYSYKDIPFKFPYYSYRNEEWNDSLRSTCYNTKEHTEVSINPLQNILIGETNISMMFKDRFKGNVLDFIQSTDLFKSIDFNEEDFTDFVSFLFTTTQELYDAAYLSWYIPRQKEMLVLVLCLNSAFLAHTCFDLLDVDEIKEVTHNQFRTAEILDVYTQYQRLLVLLRFHEKVVQPHRESKDINLFLKGTSLILKDFNTYVPTQKLL